MKVGVPHILIRTSGCNLRCTFKGSICDTAYSSWNPEKGKYSLNDVVDIIIMNSDKMHAYYRGRTDPSSRIVEIVDRDRSET